MLKMRSLLVLFFVLVMFPASSMARNIYLNGVKINALLSQTFVNVKVKIDARGDLYIFGSQYKVRIKGNHKPLAKKPSSVAPAKKKAPVFVGPRPSKGYVAVVQRSMTKGSGYAVNLKINGHLVRKMSLAVEQDVFKITKYLKKGNNRIVVEAFKMNAKVGGTFVMMLGAGKVQGGRVFIQQPYLLNYKRNGSETKSYRHIYNITVK